MSSCASFTARRTPAFSPNAASASALAPSGTLASSCCSSDRLGREHSIEADLAGEAAEERGRPRSVRPVAAKARAFQYRHADSSCSDGGIASIAARTSGQAPARSAARTRQARSASFGRPHCRLRGTTARQAGTAAALHGRRSARSRTVDRLRTTGRAASPTPRERLRHRCVRRARARRARDRFRRDASTGIPFRSQVRTPGSASTCANSRSVIRSSGGMSSRSIARGERCRLRWQGGSGRDGRRPTARRFAMSAANNGSHASGVFCPVNQSGFASANGGAAVALASILDRVARELGVLARRRRIEGGERRPTGRACPAISANRRATCPRVGVFGQRAR